MAESRAVPRLLPQEVEALLAAYPPGIRELALRLRTSVLALLGEPEERVYPGWRALGYRDARAGYVCGIFPRAGEVRLLFEHGTALADPEGLFTGGGRQTRYLALRPGDEVPEASIRAMLERAVLYGAVR